MKTQYLKSYAKINLFLKVGKKIKKQNLHNIQSLIFLINLFDVIKIKQINYHKDVIKFFGKFKGNVSKLDNTISKSMKLLREKGFIKRNDKYSIEIKKNIPVFSGFGGGSSNAATIIKFLLGGAYRVYLISRTFFLFLILDLFCTLQTSSQDNLSKRVKV